MNAFFLPPRNQCKLSLRQSSLQTQDTLLSSPSNFTETTAKQPLTESAKKRKIPNRKTRKKEPQAVQQSLQFLALSPNTANTIPLSLNCVQGIAVETKLIDIPLDKFGTLIGLRCTIMKIPPKAIKIHRNIFIHVMQELLVSHYKQEDEELLWWKKFFLLPTILFSNKSIQEQVSYANLIREDRWDFKLSDFSPKQATQQLRILESDPALIANRNTKLVNGLIKDQNISKAMNCLQRTAGVPLNEESFAKLQGKFPRLEEDSEDYRNQMEELVKIAKQIPVTAFDINLFRSVCQKGKKGARPGIDGLRFEHIHQLVGHTTEPQDCEYHLTNKLAEILSIIAAGKAPNEAYSFLRNNEVIGIPKDNKDVRPIGMGNTYRKLVSKYLLTQMQHFNSSHFKNLQYAMKKNGMEEIIHSLRLTLETDPTLHLYSIDACNAFNNGNRMTSLQEINEHFPKALPFLLNMYGYSSCGYLFGMEDCIREIISEIGFHQGDVLANWCYIISIQPLLLEIKEMLIKNHPKECCVIKFYVDDGYFVAPFKAMQDIIQILDSSNTANKYGFKLNKLKGCYLMGKTNSSELSNKQFNILVEQHGLNPEIIQHHPDNYQPNKSGDQLDYKIRYKDFRKFHWA
jgi:hypothetical protein